MSKHILGPMRRTLGIVAVVIGLAPVAFQARQAPGQSSTQPRFRAGTDLLELDVSVLDPLRRPVRGLTARDFTVVVNGKAQPIVAFTEVTVPATPAATASGASWMREYSPDVVSNTTTDDGRLVILMFNPAWRVSDTAMAYKIANTVVDELGPADLGAVMSTRGRLAQGFTTDRVRLRAAINRPMTAVGEEDDPAACFCGTCVHERITTIAEALATTRRRKILLNVGTLGVILETSNPVCSLPVKEASRRMLAAIDRANLTVYQIDPSGIRTTAPTAEAGGIPAMAPGAVSMAYSAEAARIIDIMRLPELTGGRIMVSNFPDREVPEAFVETSSYYLIGIAPPASRADSADSSLSVTTRRKDLLVMAPRSYAEPKAVAAAGKLELIPPDMPTTLWPAIDNVLASRERPLAVAATPIAMLPDGKAAVALLVDGEWSPVPPSGLGGSTPSQSDSISLVAGAFDADGKQLAMHVQRILRSQIERRSDGHFAVMARLVLEPGQHDVRVALEEPGGAHGSVYTYVDVPDFHKDKVALSGLLLDSGSGAVAGESGLFGDELPFAPAPWRTFGKDDYLTAWVRVFQAAGERPEDVELAVRLVNTKDDVVMSRASSLQRDQFGDEHSAQYRINLPVADLGPGEYLLTITAKRGEEQARGHVRFAMR